MDRNSAGPSGLRQRGTWRSGGESPSFPGSGDARRLLEAVGLPPNGIGCSLVRVRLGDSDRLTLVRVHEHLLGEESIVGTSIGRDAGPDDPGTFDILAVPDYDPVTVGRAISEVDDVVGVAATAFGSPDSSRPSPGEIADTGDDVLPSIADEPVTRRSSVTDGGDEPIDDELEGSVLPTADDADIQSLLVGAASEGGRDPASDADSTTPTVDGLSALEEMDDGTMTSGSSEQGIESDMDSRSLDDGDGRGVARRSDVDEYRSDGATVDRSTGANGEHATGVDETEGPASATEVIADPREDRSGFDGEKLRERLDELDQRLRRLEATFDGENPETASGSDTGSDDDLPAPGAVADRLASLEDAITELERRQRQIRDALTSGPTEPE